MASKDLPCASQATMTASLSCFVFEGAAYNIIFLGRVLPAAGKQACVIPFGILFNLVWGLALISYVRAHLADPGRLPQRWQEFVRTVGDSLPVVPSRQEWQPGRATFCDKCDIPRPERAHHCINCGTCVLRMDHHCVWIDNCVGFSNHKFFFLLVIYASLASIIAVVTSLPEFLFCLVVLTGLQDGLGLEAGRMLPYLRKTDILSFVIAGILSLFFAALLIPMVYTHVPLATRNETAIESNYKNMPNPFDQGSRIGNLSQIFGVCGPDWFVPVQPLRPVTDGVSFRRNDEPNSTAISDVSAAVSCVSTPLSAGWGDEENEEIEKLWRQRYRVRRPQPKPADTPTVSAGPLTSLARWWNSGSGAEPPAVDKKPSAASWSKRELALA